MKTKPILESETIELSTVPNTMNCELIQTLVDNYRKNHLVSIKDKLGIDDAHSIHFDLATLKKFISDIEDETKKNNPGVTDEDLGIRFYYAAYPKAEDWAIMANTPISVEYAERHTLVMIPTMKMEDEEGMLLNYDINPLDSDTYNINSNRKAIALNGNTGLSSLEALSQNHGNLVPPDDKKVEMF